MINESARDRGPDPDAGDPGPAPDTGAPRVTPGGDLAPGAGGGPRAPAGGDLTPETAADAPGPEIEGRMKSTGNGPKLHPRATAAPDAPAAPAGNGTEGVAACLDHPKNPDLPRENCPARHRHAGTRRRKRRTRTARETVTETAKKTATETGKNGNVPPARRAKIKTRIETESLTARREM